MIRIENLSVAFDGPEVVKNVSLTIENGEILGIVGESGSGKSVTALTLMGLVSKTAKVTSGKIYYDDVLLQEAGVARDEKLYRSYQGEEMSMVFQEPMTSLNPTQKVGKQVDEMLYLHRAEATKEERKALVLEAFTQVGLREVEKVFDSYPHQLSGGMRQRVMIAMAIILHPGLVVADEVTTALDVTIQNQIIELLREINEKQKNSMIFITHDLNLARRLCHRIAVMKDGCLVECDATEAVFGNPKEEYTKKLIQAVPTRMAPVERTKKSDEKVLEVRHLNVYYKDGASSLFGRGKKHCVVENADFVIKKGEILGLVGESGCGKTSLSKAILGMNKNIEGTIEHFTQRPQMIFQDPYSSLNPSKTIGWLLEEPLRAADRLDRSYKLTESDRKSAAMDMLKKVGLSEKYYNRRPSELSGGQRQRISIGQALITGPGLVIADEPVSALDVTIQAQILELIRKLQEELEISFLFISHDINVIYRVSDRIMVMKKGKIVEIGETEEVFLHPKEAYTKELLK